MVPQQETPVAFYETYDQNWMETEIIFVGFGHSLNTMQAEPGVAYTPLCKPPWSNWRGDHVFHPFGEWAHIIVITVHPLPQLTLQSTELWRPRITSLFYSWST